MVNIHENRPYFMIFILFLFWIIIFLPLNVILAGGVETEERVIVSHGETSQEAVLNGLVEAVRQVQGLEIEALEETRGALEDVIVRENGKDYSHTEISEEIKQEVTTETEGVIDGYDVKSVNELTDGQWEVMLDVRVPRYESRTAAGEETSNLAIMPLEVEADSPGNINLEEIARQITQGISSRAIQSDFFRVLDREHEDIWEDERSLIMGDEVPTAEKARLGEKLGADYLVAGTLSEVHSNLEQVDYHGIEATSYRINLNVSMRVIEFATREIVWADTINVERSGLLQKRDLNEIEILNTFIPEIVENLSDRFNQNLVDILMPLYIIEVRGNQIYLNQGGNRFSEGEELKVMGPPEQIDDPYMERTRTITGKERARIKINEIRDDHSIADLIQGDNNDLREGLMVERSPTIQEPEKTSILLADFVKSAEVKENMGKILSTPLAESLHTSLLNSQEFPLDVDIVSTRGIETQKTMDEYIDLPSYIVRGEVRDFQLKKLDKVSGIFAEKYALEFTGNIGWRILDEDGNTLLMEEEEKVFDFETTEITEDDPDKYYEDIDDTKIIEAIDEILENVKEDVIEVVSTER